MLSACVALVLIPVGVSFLQIEEKTTGKQDPLAYPKIELTDQPIYPVAGAVDGDTVELVIDGKKALVGLIGVQAPKPGNIRPAPVSLALLATESLDQLIHGQKVWALIESDKVDRNKRKMAYLFRVPDGLFVNLEMIRQGTCRAYTRFPFEHKDLFKAYEKQAKRRKVGLWSTRPVFDPPSPAPGATAPDGITLTLAALLIGGTSILFVGLLAGFFMGRSGRDI